MNIEKTGMHYLFRPMNVCSLNSLYTRLKIYTSNLIPSREYKHFENLYFAVTLKGTLCMYRTVGVFGTLDLVY